MNKKVLILTSLILILLIFASGIFYYIKYRSQNNPNQIIELEMVQGMSREQRTIRVYIKPEIEESRLLSLKRQVENHEVVQTMDYKSAVENLEKLKLEHQSDTLWLKSINELKTNPIGGSFKIIVKQVSDRAILIDFIKQVDSTSIIERIDSLPY